MKKLLSVVLVTVLVASFLFAIVAQAKPTAGVCHTLCNKTTYKLIECCTYVMPNGDDHTTCKSIGWCYPE